MAEGAPDRLLHLADSLFEGGKYTEAFGMYEEILKKVGAYSPQMLLKMAYVREGLEDHAGALYYLNLYHRHNPDEKTLLKMASLADEKQLKGYRYDDRAYFFFLLNKHRTAIILGLLAFAAIFPLAVFQIRRKGGQAIPIAVFQTVITALIVFVVFVGPEKPQGIINNATVFLMDSPSAGGKLLATVGKGHKVDILGQEDIWYRIRWEGTEAYIRKHNVWRFDQQKAEPSSTVAIKQQREL